ncbi:hypothetical protein AVEN_56444-1 [Araneus ventricosus]|uniref:Uncharacterized protein n=1 Tax=Araneus ventricosus TaxID=182803 RepID=A0A4Y2RV59_ARAVE|nr:hypothetical protein AVEN_56444-1 [Araneus ventricosus]
MIPGTVNTENNLQEHSSSTDIQMENKSNRTSGSDNTLSPPKTQPHSGGKPFTPSAEAQPVDCATPRPNGLAILPIAADAADGICETIRTQ